MTAASVKRKSVQSIDAGGLDSVDSVGKPVDAGASSSIESEYINRTNLDTAFIGTAHSNVEEEDVDGFLFQASKTMFPLEEVIHNQLAEVDDEELHNLEARFGIEVLSFKDHRCSFHIPMTSLAELMLWDSRTEIFDLLSNEIHHKIPDYPTIDFCMFTVHSVLR